MRFAAGLLVPIVVGVVGVVGIAGIASPAHAELPPITSRDYAIDLYDGVAIGDSTMIGMGGAGAADVIGTAGVLINPSAIAVRPTTDHDTWSLDYHFDYVTGQYSSDYDNNGVASSGGAELVTAGFGGRYHDWALALTFTAQTTPEGDGGGGGDAPAALTASVARARLALAKWIPDWDLAIGGGFQTATFQVKPTDNNVFSALSTNHSLFSISGTGVIAGATWLPHLESFRLAAAIDGPIDGGQVKTSTCDPADCMGHILPDRVREPWRLVAGGAYRIAPTAWNQQVVGPFRDEPALTVAADVVVTGATADGFGLEAFGMNELQRSGRHTAVSVRGGVDYELMPGRMRLRAGSYWEPERFEDVSGRLHGTFGIDLRVLEFHLWGPRRGRLSFTGDVASQYRNLAFAIGFWH
ncbi:MAG TPA: hypothetical protein VH165_19110 [Kofleriaceae bacterium]|nr:hypothetical protein [Kofleriaceae bacterium]